MPRVAMLLVVLALVLGIAAPVGAGQVGSGTGLPAPLDRTTSATWTRTTSGPAVVWDAVAFAPGVGRLVSYGGTAGYTLPTGVSMLDPKTGVWTTIKAARGWPSARAHARMAWDPVGKRLVMFGGRALNGALLQDTWAFNPSTRVWTALITSCKRVVCPPARGGGALVWSSTIRKLVLFGGFTADDWGLNDTWTFDGTAWKQLSTTSGPSGRYLFGMAEDAASGALVVYGGVERTHAGAGDLIAATADARTWTLDPVTGAWTAVQTQTVPEGRAEIGMAYVGSLGGVVVSTGSPVGPTETWSNSTWVYDVATKDWNRVPTGNNVPTPRNNATLTANPADGSAILNGGTGDNQFPITLSDRTWILR
jgi:hypothetical protein